jgi:MscS family membrane protein
MERLEILLRFVILENTVEQWLCFIGILSAGILLKKALSFGLSRIIYRFIKREVQNVPLADFVRLMHRPFEFLISLLTLYWACTYLHIPDAWAWSPVTQFGPRMILYKGFYSILAGAACWLGIRLIKFIGLIAKENAARTPSPLDDQLVPFLKDLGILIWILVCFFLMLSKVYHVNVWALITSLGIGGLVVALAARETLENIIASVSIMVERSFVVGDAVVLGSISGDVEQIGFRSTRLRADDGSLITIPNRLMVSQALENTTKRSYRRQKTYLKLTPDTPRTTLENLLSELEAYLNSHPNATLKPPVVRLEGFGERSLDVLVIYWVNTADWRTFIEVRESINLQIVQMLQERNIALAEPLLGK